MKLKIQNLRKSYDEHLVLKIDSLDIPDVQVIALLGKSGSGKSTLLRLLGRLETPDSGDIQLDKNSFGFVFQSFNLFPHLTALDNIVLPLQRVHGKSKQEAEHIAHSYLKRFGLQDHALKKPAQLSGGQKQRVAIVRALAVDAQILLLDEPTSALDPLMTAEVLDMISNLDHMILSSHHMGFVKQIADYVVFLDNGEVIEYGPTEEFFRSPKTEAARQFLAKVLKY